MAECCLLTITQRWPGIWDVTCRCGFKVESLSSHEAADDTAAWHAGRPSALGGVR